MDLPAEIRAMVEGMDSSTYNHSVRTWRFARMVEAYFCLGGDALSDAAYVHDVGKLFIPDRILDKHGGWILWSVRSWGCILILAIGCWGAMG